MDALAAAVEPQGSDEPLSPTAAEPQGGSAQIDDLALLDDLTLIEGVTDTMARALASEGLGSFFAVSNAPEDQLRRALRVNRIRSAPGIGLWAARAAELAAAANAADIEVAEAPDVPETIGDAP